MLSTVFSDLNIVSSDDLATIDSAQSNEGNMLHTTTVIIHCLQFYSVVF